MDPAIAPRVVHTVSRLDDLSGLLAHDPAARFVLEQLTSMRRHGMGRRDLAEAARTLAAATGAADWPASRCTCRSTSPPTSARSPG